MSYSIYLWLYIFHDSQPMRKALMTTVTMPEETDWGAYGPTSTTYSNYRNVCTFFFLFLVGLAMLGVYIPFFSFHWDLIHCQWAWMGERRYELFFVCWFLRVSRHGSENPLNARSVVIVSGHSQNATRVWFKKIHDGFMAEQIWHLYVLWKR